MTRQQPPPVLQPWIQSLWASPAGRAAAPREHVLPSGCIHLAIRLDATPLRLYDTAEDLVGVVISDAVVGGVRSHYYLKDTSQPSRSVGALLRPGAAQALFGCSADELAERHIPLDLLWKTGDLSRLRERLQAADDPTTQLSLLAQALAAQLRPARALHPQVAQALQGMMREQRIAQLVSNAHASHRHFIALFREATGLAPKRYARVMRLQRLLRDLHRAPSWADAALAAGYSDQAHFIREFRAFAGMTPQAYRRSAPATSHHVPVARPR
ncbi:MAG TPA: helix-turn-helix transcriptional regulator [Stenotrophomonas sp.]|jgi:AraC-like DNA-binding protein